MVFERSAHFGFQERVRSRLEFGGGIFNFYLKQKKKTGSIHLKIFIKLVIIYSKLVAKNVDLYKYSASDGPGTLQYEVVM